MNESYPIRVAVVDDHDLFRASFIRLLNDYQDLNVVLEAGTGSELLENLNQILLMLSFLI